MGSGVAGHQDAEASLSPREPRSSGGRGAEQGGTHGVRLALLLLLLRPLVPGEPEPLEGVCACVPSCAGEFVPLCRDVYPAICRECV